ncbi:hypothetical protein ACFE04_010611 [Oxalis oulophora]
MPLPLLSSVNQITTTCPNPPPLFAAGTNPSPITTKSSRHSSLPLITLRSSIRPPSIRLCPNLYHSPIIDPSLSAITCQSPPEALVIRHSPYLSSLHPSLKLALNWEDGVVAWTVGECKSQLLGKGRGTAGQRLERGGCWTAGQRGKRSQVVAEQKTGQLGIGERRHDWAECMARLGRRNRHGWARLMLVVDSQGWSWMVRDGRDWAEFID